METSTPVNSAPQLETCGTPVKKHVVKSATSTFRRGDRVPTPKKRLFEEVEEDLSTTDEISSSFDSFDSMQANSIPWASAEEIIFTKLECRITHLEEMLATVLDFLKK